MTGATLGDELRSHRLGTPGRTRRPGPVCRRAHRAWPITRTSTAGVLTRARRRWPSTPARASARCATTCSRLTEAKLIRPGDQSAVAKYPPNRRPVVYDLAMERIASKPSDCAYCGNPADTTDHVIPVSRGGTNLPANRVPACGRCNSSKRDLTLEEWIATGRAPAMALEVQSTAPQEVQPTAPRRRSGVQPTAVQLIAPQSGMQPTAPQGADDLQDKVGCNPASPQEAETLGCNTAQPGVQPTAYKPPMNLKNSPTESSKGGVGGGHSFDANGTPPRRTRAKPPSSSPVPVRALLRRLPGPQGAGGRREGVDASHPGGRITGSPDRRRFALPERPAGAPGLRQVPGRLAARQVLAG